MNLQVERAIELFTLDEQTALQAHLEQLKLQDPESYWIAVQELEGFIFDEEII